MFFFFFYTLGILQKNKVGIKVTKMTVYFLKVTERVQQLNGYCKIMIKINGT